jgi:hypothetical protein
MQANFYVIVVKLKNIEVMKNADMTQNANTDFVKFLGSLDDENPCSSCKIRMMLMEMMNNKE